MVTPWLVDPMKTNGVKLDMKESKAWLKMFGHSLISKQLKLKRMASDLVQIIRGMIWNLDYENECSNILPCCVPIF